MIAEWLPGEPFTGAIARAGLPKTFESVVATAWWESGRVAVLRGLRATSSPGAYSD